MLERNKPIDIPAEDMFQYDCLNRKLIIENLSRLIISTSDGITICINGGWGSGKTTFVRLWQEYLKKHHNIQGLYFNAWENDFFSDPLVALLAELNAFLEKKFPKQKQILDRLKKSGKAMLTKTAPVFSKIALQKITGLEDERIDEILNIITENVANEFLDKHNKEKKSIEEFKKILKELINKIDRKPIVIFVDELDRCRPLYAIEMLERIKHVFGVDGVIFVFALDKKQLCQSIKSQYGDIDAEEYLKRFIDLDFNLPETLKDKDKFIEFLFNKYKIQKVLESKNITENLGRTLEYVQYCINLLNLSLRDAEQAFMRINVAVKTLPQRDSYYMVLAIVFFVFLKQKNDDLFYSLIKKTKDKEEIIKSIFVDYLGEQELYGVQDYSYEAMIKAIILSVAETKENIKKIIEDKKSELNRLREKEKQRNREIAVVEYIIEFIKPAPYNGSLRNSTNFAIKQVGFLNNFNLDTKEPSDA